MKYNSNFEIIMATDSNYGFKANAYAEFARNFKASNTISKLP